MKNIAYISTGLSAETENKLLQAADYCYRETSIGRKKNILPVVLTQLEAGQTLLISSLEDLSNDFNKLIRILKKVDANGACVRTFDHCFDSKNENVQKLLHLKNEQDNRMQKAKKSEGGGRPSLPDELILKINQMCDEGHSIKEISSALKISTSTIYKYRK